MLIDCFVLYVHAQVRGLRRVTVHITFAKTYARLGGMKKALVLGWVLVGATLLIIGSLILSLNINRNKIGFTNISSSDQLSATWEKYLDSVNQFSIDYPSVLTVDPLDKEDFGDDFLSYVYFNGEDGKVGVIWLKIISNSARLSPLEFWATEFPFWRHAGDLIPETKAEKLKEAEQYFSKMEQISVGKDLQKGYRITVADVLTRTEAFWFEGDRVFNLGFSPQDKSYGFSAEQKANWVTQMLMSYAKLN